MSVYDQMNLKYTDSRATPREFAIGFAVAGAVLGVLFGWVELSGLIFGAP
jgi:hypothetical protein